MVGELSSNIHFLENVGEKVIVPKVTDDSTQSSLKEVNSV